MDTNNKENRPIKTTEKSLEKLESKIVFNNNHQHLFIFKKTEKVVAALYLITNLIKDSEPIKWKIRNVGLELLSKTVLIQQGDIHAKKNCLIEIATGLSELSTFTKIGFIGKHISEMNYTILVKEFSLLLESIDSFTEELLPQGSTVLSPDFFAVAEPVFNRSVQPIRPVITSNYFKGQNVTDKNIKDTKNAVSEKDTKKGSRRDVILRLLKDGKVLGIKDFSKEIKDCSEKTIQRELLALVQEGVLNKTGERRWSTYSLANV